MLLLEDSAPTAEEIIRKANNRLTTPQRIRSHTIWPEADMPRGLTLKVKRGLVAAAVRAGEKGAAALTKTSQDRLEAILSCLSGELPADIDEQTRLADGLGLSSIDLIELTCLLEEAYQIELDDARITVETSLEELRRIVQAPTSRSPVYPFPRWSRSWPVCLIRSVAQHALILPYIRFYCPTEVRGLQLLKEVEPPMIFTANHQSHFDTPVILALLPRRFRRLLAPAMAPDFFREYLQPDEAPLWTQLVKGWYYLLVVGLLNCYPFARTEGFRYNLQYTGELLDNGWCPLIFPEGRICPTEKIEPFKPGIGLIVSRMRVPVVPIRLRGTMEIFPRDATRPLRRGRVIVTIGEPLRFEKGSYREIVARIETAIRAL